MKKILRVEKAIKTIRDQAMEFAAIQNPDSICPSVEYIPLTKQQKGSRLLMNNKSLVPAFHYSIMSCYNFYLFAYYSANYNEIQDMVVHLRDKHEISFHFTDSECVVYDYSGQNRKTAKIIEDIQKLLPDIDVRHSTPEDYVVGFKDDGTFTLIDKEHETRDSRPGYFVDEGEGGPARVHEPVLPFVDNRPSENFVTVRENNWIRENIEVGYELKISED